MRILNRYIIFEVIPPFLLSLGVMTLILMLLRIFKLFELIITKGIAISIVGELFLYYLPAILVLSAPMSILVATLIAFGRLSEDNEITAMKATGISLYRLVIPVLLVAILLAVLMAFFYDTVLPISNHRLKNLLMDIGMKRPDLNMQEGVFIDDFPGYQLLIQKIDDQSGYLESITIFKQDSGRVTEIIIAQNGQMGSKDERANTSGDTITMILYNGEIHQLNPKEPERYRRMKFDTYTLHLKTNTELIRQERDYKSDDELPTSELEKRVEKVDEAVADAQKKIDEAKNDLEVTRAEKQIESYSQIRNALLVLIYQKFSIPFASVAFVLIGIPFGIMVRRSGKGVGFGVSTGFFLIYYVFMVSGQSLGTRGYIPPLFAMWLPNLVLSAIGVILIIRTVNEMTTVEIVPRPLVWAYGKTKKAPRWLRFPLLLLVIPLLPVIILLLLANFLYFLFLKPIFELFRYQILGRLFFRKKSAKA
jgi:lipopolysaccharide export system permease protein